MVSRYGVATRSMGSMSTCPYCGAEYVRMSRASTREDDGAEVEQRCGRCGEILGSDEAVVLEILAEGRCVTLEELSRAPRWDRLVAECLRKGWSTRDLAFGIWEFESILGCTLLALERGGARISIQEQPSLDISYDQFPISERAECSLARFLEHIGRRSEQDDPPGQ